MTDSDRSRSVLQATVNALEKQVSLLRDHERQVWQYMYGQVPNGRDIEPKDDSWCGQMSEANRQLKRLGFFLVGTTFAFGIIDHRDAVMALFRILGK